MNAFSKMKSGALATALLLSLSVVAPQALAHACTGKATITIKAGKDFGGGHQEYWYFQGGKVCGRFVS